MEMREQLIMHEWTALQSRMRQETERTLQAQNTLVLELMDRALGGGPFELQESGTGTLTSTACSKQYAALTPISKQPQAPEAPEASFEEPSYEGDVSYVTVEASQEQTLHSLHSLQPLGPLNPQVSSGSRQARKVSVDRVLNEDEQSFDSEGLPSVHSPSEGTGEVQRIRSSPRQTSPRRTGMSSDYGSQASDDLSCVCGNICMPDSKYCRMCGEKRPLKIQKTGTQSPRLNLKKMSSGKISTKDLYLTVAANINNEEKAQQDLHARMLKKVFDVLDWWYGLNEPTRTGPVSALVESTAFQTVTMLVVLSNCFFIMLVKNHGMEHIGEEMPAEFFLLECVYAVYFTLELALRLISHRMWFFMNDDWGWNILDSVIVTLSLWGVAATLVGENVVQLTFLRSLRTLRLARVLRLLRVVKVFNDLRVMVSALLSSLLALFWCCVLLAFIMMLFSLVFVQLMEDFISDFIAENGLSTCVENLHPILGDGCLNDHLMYHFGSVQRAMLSLYMATSGGNDWSLYYNLTARVSETTASFFIFYTAFYFFGIFNLLTGMFVDKAMKAGQPDSELLSVEQRIAEDIFVDAFGQILEEFDANHDGLLDTEEYVNVVTSNKGRMYLNMLGLEPRHTEVLYRELKAINRDCPVPLDEFVKGCTRMRGMPCNMDMRALQWEVGVLREELRSFINGRESATRKKVRKASRTASRTASQTTSNPTSWSDVGGVPTAPPVATASQIDSSGHRVDSTSSVTSNSVAGFVAHAKRANSRLPKSSSGGSSSMMESL